MSPAQRPSAWIFATIAASCLGLTGCSGGGYNPEMSGMWHTPAPGSAPAAQAATATAQAPAPNAVISSTDERYSPEDPTVADINSGLTATTAPVEPQFVGQPVADDGDRPARFVGAMNIYGEMPGSPAGMPQDRLDNLRQVSFTQDGADFDVSVSPDGQWLVYASTQHRPTSDIYMKRIDSQTLTQVTFDVGNDTMPAISPDGKTIAFCSDRSGSWDIYLQTLDGGQPTQLTSDTSHELHPSWSPDGQSIVFCALGEQSGQWEIVLVDVQRPGSRKFLGYGLFPEFSPDGKKIAYQLARQRGTRWFSLWTMDLVDGEAKHPTQIAASTNAAVITPTWSPDGRRLAFATVLNPRQNDPSKRPQQADLWTVNVDGSGRVKLTSDKFVNLQPAWGSDGWLYFVTNRSGTDNIWAVRPSEPTMARQGTSPGNAEASVPVQP